jgi:hypothetical protein
MDRSPVIVFVRANILPAQKKRPFDTRLDEAVMAETRRAILERKQELADRTRMGYDGGDDSKLDVLESISLADDGKWIVTGGKWDPSFPKKTRAVIVEEDGTFYLPPKNPGSYLPTSKIVFWEPKHGNPTDDKLRTPMATIDEDEEDTLSSGGFRKLQEKAAKAKREAQKLEERVARQEEKRIMRD